MLRLASGASRQWKKRHWSLLGCAALFALLTPSFNLTAQSPTPERETNLRAQNETLKEQLARREREAEELKATFIRDRNQSAAQEQQTRAREAEELKATFIRDRNQSAAQEQQTRAREALNAAEAAFRGDHRVSRPPTDPAGPRDLAPSSAALGGNFREAPPTDSITLMRTGYKLPKQKAAQLAAFLNKFVEDLDAVVQDDKLIVTTTPEVQRKLAEMLFAISERPQLPESALGQETSLDLGSPSYALPLTMPANADPVKGWPVKVVRTEASPTGSAIPEAAPPATTPVGAGIPMPGR